MHPIKVKTKPEKTLKNPNGVKEKVYTPAFTGLVW